MGWAFGANWEIMSCVVVVQLYGSAHEKGAIFRACYYFAPCLRRRKAISVRGLTDALELWSPMASRKRQSGGEL